MGMSADAGQALHLPVNNRMYPRITAPPLHVANLDAVVVNVSPGGVCLRTCVALVPGEECVLVLEDGYHQRQHVLRARVAWTMGDRAGLHWVRLSPEQCLWLMDCCREWLQAQCMRRDSDG
jgi:hypothetical protein